MRDGTSPFSPRSDRRQRSGNSSKLWLFPIVGAGYAIVYYTVFRVPIKALDLKRWVVNTTDDAKRVRPAKWRRLCCGVWW